MKSPKVLEIRRHQYTGLDHLSFGYRQHLAEIVVDVPTFVERTQDCGTIQQGAKHETAMPRRFFVAQDIPVHSGTSRESLEDQFR